MSKLKNRVILPQVPDCEFGYTEDQLHEILGDRYDKFLAWHWGRTYVECDGTRLYPEFGKYGECCDGVAHGDVYYWSDVKEFISR